MEHSNGKSVMLLFNRCVFLRNANLVFLKHVAVVMWTSATFCCRELFLLSWQNVLKKKGLFP